MSQPAMPRRTKLTIAFVVLFALCAMLLGVYSALQKSQASNVDFSTFNATVLSEARTIIDFELLDNQGATFTNDQLTGKWSMLYFGFSNCPHVCPTTMDILANVYNSLKTHRATLPQVTLVTVDPARDDIDKLDTYVSAFNETFIGITGEKEALDNLAKHMGIVHMKVQDEENTAEHYDINHTDAVILVNPQGEIVAFFTAPHDAENIATEFQLITANFA